MTTLSDAIVAANTNNLSARRIQERARQAGHKVDNSTVSRYMRGEHPNPPKRKTLLAIASALSVDVAILEEAAGLAPRQEPFLLPAEADALDSDERAAIISLVKVMVRNKKVEKELAVKPWQKNLPSPDDMVYHIGAPTPTGGKFRPDQYQDDRLIWDRHGKNWFKHYSKATSMEEPGDDIEEPWEE